MNEFEEEKIDEKKLDFYSLVEKEYDNSKDNIKNFKILKHIFCTKIHL